MFYHTPCFHHNEYKLLKILVVFFFFSGSGILICSIFFLNNYLARAVSSQEPDLEKVIVSDCVQSLSRTSVRVTIQLSANPLSLG